jgi:hypothetical protein
MSEHEFGFTIESTNTEVDRIGRIEDAGFSRFRGRQSFHWLVLSKIGQDGGMSPYVLVQSTVNTYVRVIKSWDRDIQLAVSTAEHC